MFCRPTNKHQISADQRTSPMNDPFSSTASSAANPPSTPPSLHVPTASTRPVPSTPISLEVRPLVAMDGSGDSSPIHFWDRPEDDTEDRNAINFWDPTMDDTESRLTIEQLHDPAFLDEIGEMLGNSRPPENHNFRAAAPATAQQQQMPNFQSQQNLQSRPQDHWLQNQRNFHQNLQQQPDHRQQYQQSVPLMNFQYQQPYGGNGNSAESSRNAPNWLNRAENSGTVAGSRKRPLFTIDRIDSVKSPRYDHSNPASGFASPQDDAPRIEDGGIGAAYSEDYSDDFSDAFWNQAFPQGLEQESEILPEGLDPTARDAEIAQRLHDEINKLSGEEDPSSPSSSIEEIRSLPANTSPQLPMNFRVPAAPTNLQGGLGFSRQPLSHSGQYDSFGGSRNRVVVVPDDTSSDSSDVEFLEERQISRPNYRQNTSQIQPYASSSSHNPYQMAQQGRNGDSLPGYRSLPRETQQGGTSYGILDEFNFNNFLPGRRSLPWENTARPHVLQNNGSLLPLNDGWEVPGMADPQYRRMHDYAMHVKNDPTRTASEIKSLLENIRPDMEIPPENREGTPDAMVYPLMEHQKIGLAWLKKAEEGKTKGGILADDMGLGKTIQTLALLVSRPSEDPKCKTTLIVAPVALLKQWEREIHKKLKPDPQYQLSVYIYHGGNKKSKQFEGLAKYDVVLTTYGTIGSEYKRLENFKARQSSGEAEDSSPNLLILAENSYFYRVVLDEAQCIKNKETQSSKGCAQLKAKYRLCLSGTPMQNNCDELYPLLRFLRVKPWDSWSQFADQFSRPLKRNQGAAQAMRKLQALLRVVLLRRTKDSKIDGHPILKLPPKEIKMVETQFTDDEQQFYESIETKSRIVFNKYVRQGQIGKNYSQILVLLLRLRQACCHPHLINDIEEPKDPVDEQKSLKLARELPELAIERIKDKEHQECPVCLDVSINPSIVIPCGHLFCSECLIQVQDQHKLSMQATGEVDRPATCPGCRGTLDPDKVIDLRTFKKVFQPNEERSEVDELFNNEFDDGLIYDSDSDDEVDADGDLKGFIVKDEEGDERDESKENVLASVNKGKRRRGVGKTLNELRKEASKSQKARARYNKHLEKRWVDSAKFVRCMQVLDSIRQKDPLAKTIIFSQFTSLLDLLEVPLTRANLTYRRYDGRMSAAKRNQALLDFQDEPDITVLIISIKAGNSGLNLVAASQVIIFDPFYNPYVELQAIDRAHRIGQQNPVTVHRLIVPNTVEDRVLALQEKKKALVEGALDENAQKRVAVMTAEDLGFLFGINR